ncbi:MAG: ribosome maturation factor RimP [Endomicrobium sp.]|jgi:ribosome maturation factor RimP|nr:ribosome maturation factor RimP [Endomicrobium sp.]
MNKIEEIENLLESIAKKENIELVDVQYVKEDGDCLVRIFIDKSDGVIKISDCENISRIFSIVLDKSDIFKDSYILEVSSPGFNRILKKEESFKRFIGAKVRIQTFDLINNQRFFSGKLLDFRDSKAKVDDVMNGIVEINFLNIKKANVETEI